MVEMKRTDISLFVAIFLISLSCLGFEICITRLFSLTFSYYYIFLALSIAMFGIGIGGFLASTIPFKEKDLMIISILLALSFPFSIILPLKVVFLLSHPLLLALPFIPPFILTSLFIALAFKFRPFLSGTIYFSDLTGASLGSLSIVFLLSVWSPINVIFLFSLLILLCIVLLSRKIRFIAFSIIIVAFLFLNKNHTVLDIPYRDIPSTEWTKVLVMFLKDKTIEAEIEKTYWNASFRTDVIYHPSSPHTRGIFVDGGAPTIMFGCEEDFGSLHWLRNSLNYFPFCVARKEKMLSIGPGGGLDIILGLLAGVELIEAVEINSSIPHLLTEYKDFNGDILASDRVAFFVGEGRNYLKRIKKCYDLIYLSLALTSSSSKMGMPLVESYLHTVDAYEDYLDHLNPDGYVAVICETNSFLQRAIFNALFALEDEGIDFREGKNHILVMANFLPESPYQYLLLLKKSPFDIEEAERMRDEVERMDLIPSYIPYIYIYEETPVGFSSRDEISNFLEETKSQQHIDLSPSTDEKPFFYDLSPGVPPFLYVLCISSLGISLIALLLVNNKTSLCLSPYFFLLGAGFMLVENALIQKCIFFLGYPITTFSITLFSFLLGCGLGGFLTQRMAQPLKKLPIIVATLCLLMLCSFLFLHTVFLVSFTLSDISRAVFSFALLLPFGILLGMPFPSLMREVGKISKKDVGFMWGINGLMSICGCSLAMIITRTYGIKYAFLASFLIYFCILVLSIKLRART